MKEKAFFSKKKSFLCRIKQNIYNSKLNPIEKMEKSMKIMEKMGKMGKNRNKWGKIGNNLE